MAEGIKKNISLKQKITFRTNGKAKYYLTVRNKNDLLKAVKIAQKRNWPFFILGGGSNIIFAGREYNGLVIEMGKGRSLFPIEKDNNCFWAGEKISILSQKFLDNSISGLEWAVGLPGTIGGAVFGNSGAFGQSIGEIIEKVEVFDLRDNKIKFIESEQCQFRYKDSFFKKRGNLIIISVCLKIKKGKKEDIRKKMEENLSYRKENQPLNFPSAGSVFKNFIIREKKTIKIPRNLKQDFSEFFKEGFIPAGYLIEKCGLKGKKIGDAKISEKHANFIVNLGKAEATDILKLVRLAKKEVRNKFNIKLEEEIRIIY